MKYTLAPFSLFPPSAFRRFLIALFTAAALACFIATQPALAQDVAATTEPNTTAVTTTNATVTPNDVNEVAKQLWCPLCSGVRLDACELKACSQMKDVIGQKLAEGVDVQSIKNYFVAQYGPQVLGEPPMEGFNWLAWVLPVAVMIGGGVFIYTRTRKMVRSAPGAAAPPQSGDGDDYDRKLDEELKHYD